MFVNGVVGMIAHFQLAVLFGWFMIVGMVFCMKPTLAYFNGCFSPGLFLRSVQLSLKYPLSAFYLISSYLELVLALNRCVNFCSPRKSIPWIQTLEHHQVHQEHQVTGRKRFR
jgi:hypothetical protein